MGSPNFPYEGGPNAEISIKHAGHTFKTCHLFRRWCCPWVLGKIEVNAPHYPPLTCYGIDPYIAIVFPIYYNINHIATLESPVLARLPDLCYSSRFNFEGYNNCPNLGEHFDLIWPFMTKAAQPVQSCSTILARIWVIFLVKIATIFETKLEILV